MSITRTCRITGKEFVITDEDLAFYDKISPIIGGEKFLIPPPTLCPEERLRRRLAWRNVYSIYGSHCILQKYPIISLYAPNRSYLSIDQRLWWSDQIENLSQENIYSLSKSFFPQLDQLIKKTYLPSLSNEYISNEQSEFVNGANNLKDCYLVFSASHCENSEYCEGMNHSNNCLDCYFTRNSENCYECISIDRCYNCIYLEESSDCSSCCFSYRLVGCSHCFLCENISNKKYCIKNQQYPDEVSYQKEKQKYYTDNNMLKESISSEFLQIKNRPGVKQNYIIGSENVKGNHISYSRDVIEGYDIDDVQNSSYVQWLIGDVRDCYDCYSYGSGLSRAYECGANGGDSSELIGCYTVWKNSHRVYYSFFCYQCEDCFGCAGLKNKRYCIYNRQYTKKEYEILIKKIVENMIRDGEWGEFLSPSISPFGYNETMAHLYFPLTKNEALKMGYQWNDYEPPRPEASKYIPASRIPENISDVPDDILNWAIECEVSGKYYMITRPELKFYRDHLLSIPRKHYDVRRRERFIRRMY